MLVALSGSHWCRLGIFKPPKGSTKEKDEVRVRSVQMCAILTYFVPYVCHINILSNYMP